MKQKGIPTLLASLLLLTGCGEKSYAVNDYRKTMDFSDEFNIMQLTDVHLGTESDVQSVFQLIDDEIQDMTSKKGKPDLIVLTGDNFSCSTKKIVTDTIEYLDRKEIPFSLLYGNHDFQGQYDRYFIANQLRKAKNAVFVDYDDDDIYGQANYFVDLVKDGVTKYRLFMLDSNSYVQNGFTMKYDIIHEDQIKHMEDIASTNGIVPSLAFFHIPLYEFDDAVKAYKAETGEATGNGTNDEKVSFGYERTDAFERMKAIGVQGMFVGHDHINDTTLMYQDVVLSYGMKSTYEIYNDDIGYVTISLHGQDKLAVSDIEKVVLKEGE